MANNVDLVLRLLAEDKASAAFKKVGGEVEATGSKFTKFGKVAAGALATIGVIKFAKDSVKAYSDAQHSQAQLEQAYRKFPRTANLSIDALREYNTELQKKTIYDDDDTAAMQAHLAMFNLSGKEIKALTPLVQDLASAQGIDLATASDAVGKALMGNTRGLKAIGVNFKATGDKAKDFAAIQQLLNRQVGGFAENEGKTAAGQAKILANQFGDLQESVGAALVPALQTMVNVLTPIVEDFNALPEPVKNATVVVGALGAGFVFLVPKIAAAKAALVEFRGANAGGVAGAAAGASKFSKVLGGVGKALPVVGTALALGGVALELFGSKSSAATDAQRDFKAALEASNGVLDENVRKTVAKRANDAGLLEQARKLGITEDTLVDALLGDAAARQKLGDKTAELIQRQDKYLQAGKTVVVQQDAQKAAALRLRSGIEELSGALSTEELSQARLNAAMGATTAQAMAVQKSWDRLRAAMKQPINGSIRISVRANGDVTVNSGSGGGRGIVPQNAAGGEARAGTDHWVGEYGPELVHFNRAARIVPASSSRASGGDTVGTVVVPLYLDNRKVAEGQVTLKRANGGSLPYLN